MSTTDGNSNLEGMVIAQPSRTSAADEARARIVPPDVERRYSRDGDRLLFPDGATAIEDRGMRLVARTGNAQVARDIVEIAAARGWTRIESRGAQAFRAEIGRAAKRRGIDVANDTRSTGQTAAEPPDPTPARGADPPPGARRPARRVGDLMTGEFLEAGKAPYRFTPGNAMSFYVRIGTTSGQRELWGTQLREALTDSWTFPQPGDRIGVQYLGTQTLRGGAGAPGEEPRRRNLWRIEKISFFEECKRDAAAIRAGGPDLSRPEALSPSVREVAAILRAANVFAASRIATGADRERFVEAVRGTLASTLEQGGRLPEVRLRERTRSTTQTSDPALPNPVRAR
jgi:hypothetical protein